MQRRRPFGRLGPRRRYTLPLDRMHTVIRIAHRPGRALSLAERIIFDHELVLILTGRGQVRVGGERFDYQPYDLLFLRPFERHAFSASEPEGSHIAVHFDLSPDVPADGDLDRRTPYEVRFARGLELPARVRLSPADAIVRDLTAVVEAVDDGSEIGQLEARLSLERALLALLRSGQAAAPGRTAHGSMHGWRRIERALRQIETRFDEPLTSDELAGTAGMSVSHFNRLFRQWVGQAPMNHLRQTRVARARTLLADPDLSVKQIAARTGFADPYHFSKVFRQVDGLPPTQYREALLAGRAGERG